jgi:hypothetical protein
MFRFCFTVALVVLLNCIAFCQVKSIEDLLTQTDSIAKKGELFFSNPDEEKYFQKFLLGANPDDAFRMMFAAMGIANDAESALKSLESDKKYLQEKTIKLKPKKKIDFIYQFIHKKYFDKYEHLAMLPEAFTTGKFNCLSASIIYAWIFHKMNIPFEAKFTDNHVFLIAYPESSSIVVEATNPMMSISSVKDSYKIEYVNWLRNMKIISSEELKNNTVADLFNTYYYGHRTGGFKELIAGNYLNLAAIVLLENMDYEKLLGCYLISNYFHQDYKSVYVVLVLAYDFFSNVNNLQLPLAAHMSVVLSRINLPNNSENFLVTCLYEITEQQLFTLGDTVLYEKSWKTIISMNTDSTLDAKLNKLYFNALGIYYMNQNEAEKSLHFLEQSFYIDPEDKFVVEMLGNALKKLAASYGTIRTDSEIMSKLDTYMEMSQAMRQDFMLRYFRISYYSQKAYDAYTIGHIEEGDKNLFQLEKIIETEGTDFLSEYDFVKVYVSASFWFYKKYDNKKAKEYIDRGLNYFPENSELKRKRRAF